ncbi:MAG: hypothetical protein ABSA83_21055, partial [Verrucomicrobiota bacterium]
QPFMDAALVPSLSYAYGGGKFGRKIAAYVLAVQRGDVKAKLDILPTDTFDEDPGSKPEPIKALEKAKETTPTKPKPLAHKKMARAPRSKSSHPHSDELKATQSDFVQPDPPVHAVHASDPSGPILPIRPIPSEAEK